MRFSNFYLPFFTIFFLTHTAHGDSPVDGAAIPPESPSLHSRSVHFGAKMGLGMVTWGGRDADNDFLTTHGKLGFSASAFVRFDLNNLLSLDADLLKLAVQPEIIYAKKGAGRKIGTLRGAFNVDYLSMAILPRIDKPVLGGRVLPYAVIGPAFGFLLKAEVENSQGNVTNIEDDFTSTDFGLILGLGADVPIVSYGTLVFELRADLGLLSIDEQGDGKDIKNRAFSLMLGYQY